MKQLLSILIISFCITTAAFAGSTTRLDSLLICLDRAILDRSFQADKENELASLKLRLANRNLSTEQQYYLYAQLTAEYEYYRCDSAYLYAQRQYAVARTTNRQDFINDSKIQLAGILFKTAMFNEAVGLLNGIAHAELSESQRFNLYKTYYETYVSWVDFYDDGYESGELNEKRDNYYEAFLPIIPPDTYEYASYQGIKHIIVGNYAEAERLIYDFLPQTTLGTRPYSILTSVLSFLYDECNDPERVKEVLALSALSDIHGNIMENSSLRTLATLLYEEGQVNRANNYITRSMEDANFYNARIRNIKISRVLPIISNAYQADKTRRQQQLVISLIVISVLSVGLLVGIFFIIGQMKKLSVAKHQISKINNKLRSKNEALADINRTLAEANQIKEEYVGHFMTLCSTYIEKMENYQRHLTNKAKTGTVEELFKFIRSTQFMKDVRDEFYQNFDDSFLRLFPDFVQEFNALLPEEERLTIKRNEKLTTELRIFALIRLGISDSAQIAEFLHYSLATIYNYRSRLRNKALNKNEFESEIMKIGIAKVVPGEVGQEM